MLGSSNYERVYTIKNIKDENEQQVAIVEMDAIPATEDAAVAMPRSARPELKRCSMPPHHNKVVSPAAGRPPTHTTGY